MTACEGYIPADWPEGPNKAEAFRNKMKLIFSEQTADYIHYQFAYAIWAIPEPGETAGDIFEAGFLPSSRQLDRFYLCRQIRLHLNEFQLSSENRRILRKGEGIAIQLVPREEFDYTPARRTFFKNYADVKFGPNVMTCERLDSLFSNPIISHLLVYTDKTTGKEVGVATLYMEGSRLAYYYYAFYDLAYANRSLGMFMMTSAAEILARKGVEQLYLGTCYSDRALYKTQFEGVQFFNGFKWSSNLEELKYLLQRHHTTDQHLVEIEAYRNLFYDGSLSNIISESRFKSPASPA